MTNERLQILARFIRNQVSLADRPPPGCIQLNNDEALLCAEALEQVERLRNDIQEVTCGDPRKACPNCRDAVEPEARLTEMNFKAKAGEPIEAYAQFEGGAVKAFAVSLVQWFRESGGENYVTCDLRDPETGEAYSITMQKAGGRTPAQDLCELRQQLNRT